MCVSVLLVKVTFNITEIGLRSLNQSINSVQMDHDCHERIVGLHNVPKTVELYTGKYFSWQDAKLSSKSSFAVSHSKWDKPHETRPHVYWGWVIPLIKVSSCFLDYLWNRSFLIYDLKYIAPNLLLLRQRGLQNNEVESLYVASHWHGASLILSWLFICMLQTSGYTFWTFKTKNI